MIRQHIRKKRWPTLLLSLRLTFLVAGGLCVSLDVALQVAAELGRGGKESQADSHQLPARRQAPGAAIARGLPHQLHVEFVPQPRHVPALGDDEQGTMAAIQARRPVSHIGLHQLEHLTGLLPDSSVAGD